MMQIALLSLDRTLQSLLSSALGKEFEVILAPTESQLTQMLSPGSCDLVLLDLDSYQDSLKQDLGCSRRILESQLPLVVMASDSRRSNAVELVREDPPALRRPSGMVDGH